MPTTIPAQPLQAYVARQPIFRKSRKIIGYELLFRDGGANHALYLDGDAATGQVLNNSLLNFGLERITGGKRAFINFTANLLLKQVPLLLPSEGIVVEILEDVPPAQPIVRACQNLVHHGYTLALDDFTYSPELKPLLDLAHVVKFDLKAASLESIEPLLALIPDRVRLLAEKVETYAEFEQAAAMGFEFFQGYFFCQPEVLSTRAIPSARLNLLQILGETRKPDVDFDQVESIVTRDLALSYKLLHYINSAFYQRVQEISSVKQALVYLGAEEVRRFTALIALAQLASDKPVELVQLSCIRAKFLELAAQAGPAALEASTLFTLGLFSMLDAILDQKMKNILEPLPLDRNIRQALVEGRGPLVAYLALIQHYERGQWSEVSRVVRQLGLPEALLPEWFAQACEWSRTLAGL